MTHLMVSDVMTKKVAALRESTPFKEIVRILAEKQIGALPVLDEKGRPCGCRVGGRPAGEGGAGSDRDRAPEPATSRSSGQGCR